MKKITNMKVPRKLKQILAIDYLEYQKQIDGEHNIKLLCKTFFNIDDKEYNTTPFNEIQKYVQIFNKTINTEQELIQKFKIGKITYAINPDFNDITMGEMIDLETDDIIQQIAILYRPIIKEKRNKYRIVPYKADFDLELFKKHITLDILMGFVSFFLKINQDYLTYTLKSLGKELDLTPEQKKTLQKSGAGTVGYIDSLMKI